MSYELWSQDVFSKGELSPYMYARATVSEYGNGLKRAQNVLTYPTGAAGKRFGTLYQAKIDGLTSSQDLYFQTFQYLNTCIFQLVFTPLIIAIYLEGVFVKNVNTTLDGQSNFNLSTTVLGAVFRVSGANFAPMDLTPSFDSPQTIASISSNQFVIAAAAFSVSVIYPVVFATSGTLPSTTPPIKAGVTYFAFTNSATHITIYPTPGDAKFSTNAITLNNVGTGTNTIQLLSVWDFSPSVFTNVPVYDFNGTSTPYDALSFTPSAVTGTATITVSGGGYAPLPGSPSPYIGGAIVMAGGTAKITAVASATSFTVSIQTPFDSMNPVVGSLVYLAEPAWSDARGWPQVCSSYQNRALFANTALLPNGFWASVINDYADFGDLTSDDDDAISWYPSSGTVNYIKFIVPYRSITVHTNTGIYSSPLSDIAAITPTNFTLQLQDSTPADVLLPQAIDNQVLVLSGDDAHQMLWDGINNAYTSDIVSVISEQTIKNPVDEVAFADLRRAGSRYVFIINESGSMAIFQTLISQSVAGFTPAVLEQSYGDAKFLQAASSADGRCWFAVQREKAVANVGLNIIDYGTLGLKASGINLPTDEATAITFTTTGTLPATTTLPLVVDQYYWAVGENNSDFLVYLTQEDALADEDRIIFTSAGTTSKVVAWPRTTYFTMEELTQDTYLDCAIQYNGTPIDTITTGALFNAQEVKMVGDGFGFDAIGIDNEVVFKAHGVDTPVSKAYIGFPINTIMEPMPLSMSNGYSAKNTTLTKPKHIRTVRFMFNNTIGGTINGVPIALNRFDQANIGEPPYPERGIFEMSVMKGWDDFNNPLYTIEHSEPFNIELLGVFYSVEI